MIRPLHTALRLSIALVGLFFFPVFTISAQVVIRGLVRSQEGKPLGNATVACLKSTSDSTVIAQVATGDNGRFALQKPAGMLPIRVSLLGYQARIY